MVKDALEYLDNLASESGGNQGLQAELATAYQKVGDVQGNPYLPNLGNQDGALDSYRKAFAIRERLSANSANDTQARFDLARSYESIGDILWAKGESADSQTSYRKALEIYENLSKTKTSSDPTSLQRLYNRIGQTQEQSGDDAALENYQSAVERALSCCKQTRQTRNTVVATINYAKLGDIYYLKHDYKKRLSRTRVQCRC
jgi:tetratricopeptide (TPR) repeat protein